MHTAAERSARCSHVTTPKSSIDAASERLPSSAFATCTAGAPRCDYGNAPGWNMSAKSFALVTVDSTGTPSCSSIDFSIELCV